MTVSPAVRPFRPTDAEYEAVARVWNLTHPDEPLAARELRHWDEARDPKCKFERFIVEGEDVLGFAYYDQNPGMYHPQKFEVRVCVSPEAQGRGLGRQLFEAVMEALSPHHPLVLRAHVQEGQTRALEFVRRGGFYEEKRDWESRLDLARFDPAPFEGAEARLQGEGIRVATLAELSRDPEMPRKFYDLFSEVRLDVPRPEPATPISFEQFAKWTFEAPDYLPEGSFVALEGEGYVGLTQLWKSEANSDLFTGLTAVRRAYRGRGVALALKLRAIAYARGVGAPALRTNNDTMNAPMLHLNEKLGFVKQPAWITFRKDLNA